MRKAELQQQAVTLIERLPTEKLKAAIDYLTDLQDEEAQKATHELANDAEIALDDILKNYDRAWKTLAKL